LAFFLEITQQRLRDPVVAIGYFGKFLVFRFGQMQVFVVFAGLLGGAVEHLFQLAQGADQHRSQALRERKHDGDVEQQDFKHLVDDDLAQAGFHLFARKRHHHLPQRMSAVFLVEEIKFNGLG